jgi:glucose dehydrogenase
MPRLAPSCGAFTRSRRQAHIPVALFGPAFRWIQRPASCLPPVSNPFPDWTGDVRPGPNLYTNALLSLNGATGALNWYYQAVPHDIHDWDLGTPAALYSTPGGKNIAVIAGKDGNVYAIDRASHVPLFVTPGTTQQNGGPFGTMPVRACPGGIGGAQFNSAAYDPQLDTLYVGMNDWCWYFFLQPDASDPTQVVGDDTPDTA